MQKRKFIELEVDTEMSNKELKVKTFWKLLGLGVKVIQITVNTAKK